jgi:hypothetical protein
MKTNKLLGKCGLVILGVIGICFGTTLNSQAYTTVYLDMADPYLDAIAAIQFDIVDPADADISNVTLNLPEGWIDFSADKLISAFDGTGDASLPNGVIGTFDIDVQLAGWELTLQDGFIIPMGDDFPLEYQAIADGADYTITNVVPVPPGIILLASGIAAIAGLRRRVIK